jgi:hypothetical protein
VGRKQQRLQYHEFGLDGEGRVNCCDHRKRGTYCAKIWDTGNLTGATAFTVNITHP